MNEIIIKLSHHGIQNEDVIINKVRKQIEKHNNERYQEIKDLIELSLKTKTLITLVKNQYRGCGKSTLLLKKAEELGATLIVTRHVKERYDPFDSTVKCFVSPEQARGASFRNNGFIVDEGVEPSIIKELSRRNEFLGGFSWL